MSASALTVRIKRRSRGGDTLFEAANRILRILGVNPTRRAKQPPVKSKLNVRATSPVRAPIAQAETPVCSPVKMQPTVPVTEPNSPTSPAVLASAPSASPRPVSERPYKPCADDYIFGKYIGEGCFSIVRLAKNIKTQKEYAIKICDKQHIKRKDMSEYVHREKEALGMLMDVPHGFVRLYCTFQDPERLYFVLSYAKNGELLAHINKVGAFELDVARFYAAELLLACEIMHARGIIHRDLKPENLLLDNKMHLQVADFGTAKVLGRSERRLQQGVPRDPHARKGSFVGTAQYVSPELLTSEEFTPASDLWALGCIIYQMLTGRPPFQASTDYLIFKKVTKLEYDFPEGFPSDAKDLVEKLLVLEPGRRLGAGERVEYTSVRKHPFFAGIEWDTIQEQAPPRIYTHEPANEVPNQQRSEYAFPDHLEPGYGKNQIVRLWEMDLSTSKGILDISEEERQRRLEKQRESPWHQFVDGELILKQGIVDKRVNCISKRRMLLLTTGPRLFYVDPTNMVLKGEIPWSKELKVEPKNFKVFFVHTPNRTYHLEDPKSFALEWCLKIDEVRIAAYGQDTT